MTVLTFLMETWALEVSALEESQPIRVAVSSCVREDDPRDRVLGPMAASALFP